MVSGYWNVLPTAPARRMSLIKISSDGGPLWAKSISFGTETVSTAMVKSSGGGFISTGYLRLQGSSDAYTYFMKTDALGVPQVAKYYSFDSAEVISQGVVELNDGSCVITAQMTINGPDKEIFIMRVDSSGTPLWAKTLEGNAFLPDYPSSIALTGNSEILVAGSTKSFAFNNYSSNAFLLKITPEGNLNWFINYYDSLQNQNDIEIYGNKIRNFGDSIYALTCTKLLNQSIKNMMLVKTDSTGTADCYYQFQTGINLLDNQITAVDFIPVVQSPGFTTTSFSTPVVNYNILMEYPCITPVEFISFSGNSVNNSVELFWSTATETSNKGFEIERSSLAEPGWELIGFVEGKGTTTEIQYYSYLDQNIQPGEYQYRLKQIDFNASGSYSNVLQIKVTPPAGFGLSQNYPNPFNPSTTISYSIPVQGKVRLIVYDALGREVRKLVDEEKDAGNYNIDFNADGLASGIYFYRLSAGERVISKKMILMR